MIGGVIRKDARLLWPLALLCAALLVLQALYRGDFMAARLFLPLLALLASTLLVNASVHQDAPASLRHDWLTRPVAAPRLLAAKMLFLAAAILMPLLAAGFIAALREGQGAGDALASAATALARVAVIGLPLIAVAAISTTLIEAAAVLVGLLVLALIVPRWAVELFPEAHATLSLGIGWIAVYGIGFAALAASLAVLWLQYARGRTALARWTFAGAALLLMASPALFRWEPMFALQKALSPDPAAADQVQLAVAKTCIAGRTGFSTDLEARVPTGWRLMPGVALAQQIGRSGEVRRTMLPQDVVAGTNSTRIARHDWTALPPGPVRLTFSLSLLAPEAAGTIPIDGRRHIVRGIGSCSAMRHIQLGVTLVSCFKPGGQPALMTAEAVGVPEVAPVLSRYPNYAPALLRVVSENRHQFSLPPNAAAATQVKVISYQARAHFDRALTLADTSCPAR